MTLSLLSFPSLPSALCTVFGERGVGGGGVWDPKVCVPKMARQDIPNGEFQFFPRWSLWSGGGGPGGGGAPPVLPRRTALLILPCPSPNLSASLDRGGGRRLGKWWRGLRDRTTQTTNLRKGAAPARRGGPEGSSVVWDSVRPLLDHTKTSSVHLTPGSIETD